MTDIPQAMQAAERTRAARDAMDSRDVYRQAFPGYRWPDELEAHDKDTLVDLALSLLPMGPRPVPVVPKYGNIECFGVCHDGVIRRLFGNMRYGNPIEPAWTYEKGDRVIFLDGPGYPTEADARLALHWQKFDALLAAAAP